MSDGDDRHDEDAAHPTTRLVLIRHGESNATVERRIAGHRTCTGLSPLGVRQAEALRDRLSSTAELSVDVFVASNYARAIETAEILAPALHADFVVDARFGEHDPGPTLDGLTFQEYVDRYGMPDWHGDPDSVVFPGGETPAQFHRRVGAGVAALLGAHPGATIVVSCHGGVVDAVFRQVLQLPARGAFELQTLNTSLTEFLHARPERWQLMRYNDAAHLDGLPESTRAA